MMKSIACFAAAAVLTLTLTGCSLTDRDLITVTKNTEVPPRMLFLGDSIAAGYGLEGYEKGDNYNCRSYSNILRDKYSAELADKCGHEMVNEAISGATSADLLELVRSGKLDGVLADSDAIVVSIGGNDLLGLVTQLFGSLGYSFESSSFDLGSFDIISAISELTSMGSEADAALDGFDENLKAISSEINERTDGVLYIQTLYNPFEYFDSFSQLTEFSEEKIGRFNQIVTDNADGSYKIVDVASVFDGQCGDVTNIKSFDIHPNFIGHQLIADAVDEAFRETGFTYTVQEYGEEYLNGYGYATVIGGIILGLTALTVPAFLVGRKTKNKKKDG